MQLLTYPGGKSRLAPWIIEHFPKHEIYCEPFGGSAAVLLQKPRVGLEIYNDINRQLVNFFKVLRKHGQELIHQLDFTPYSRECEEDPTDDEIELARRFFHASVTQWHDGYFKTQKRNPKDGTLVGVYERQKGYLPKAASRLKEVIIEQMDALDLIRKYDSPEMLFYCDPPYFGDRKRNLYKSEMMGEKDHVRLAEILKECRGMVVLSRYATPLYEDLYQGWVRVCRAAQARSKEMRTECLWIKPVKDVQVIVSVPSKAKRRSVSEITKSRVKAAAKHPENGIKISDGRPPKRVPGTPLSKATSRKKREIENGISRSSQKRLDKIARLHPELLNKIAKGELSIKGALKLCEGSKLEIRQDAPVEKLKKAFSKLTEEEKDQFRIWLREDHLISRLDYPNENVISTNV